MACPHNAQDGQEKKYTHNSRYDDTVHCTACDVFDLFWTTNSGVQKPMGSGKGDVTSDRTPYQSYDNHPIYLRRHEGFLYGYADRGLVTMAVYKTRAIMIKPSILVN